MPTRMPLRPLTRAATIAAMILVLFGIRFAFDSPSYTGVGFLLVMPTVLAALWFGVLGGVLAAIAGALTFPAEELIRPTRDPDLANLLPGTLLRAVALVLVGILVARLFARQVALAHDLEELESARDALRPTELVARPELELAAHFVPAEHGVGGDFFLATEGPRGSTVLVLGDVVGKGVLAARRAVFVRTTLLTSAPFEDDPARLLQLANAALIDRAGVSLEYVTATCVVHRPTDGTVAWAIAGHPAPLWLDEGRLFDDHGAGQPLGIVRDLVLTTQSRPLEAGGGVLLYTDGILDARDAAGGVFGEERLAALVAEHRGASAEEVVEALTLALADYAPSKADDVCLLAARDRSGARAFPGSAAVGSEEAG